MKSTLTKQLFTMAAVLVFSIGSASAAIVTVTSTEDLVIGDGPAPAGLESDNTAAISGVTPQAIEDYYYLDVLLDGLVTLAGSSANVNTNPTTFEPLSLDIFSATANGADWDIDDAAAIKSAVLSPLSLTLLSGDYIVRVHSADRLLGVVGALAPPGTTFNYNLNVTSAVPVPAAVWLFGTALVGMLGLRRKNKGVTAAA